MTMDEDKLYDLFAGYKPDLSSDRLFMSRLQQNLEAVELVKERLEKSRSKNRIAILVAAITGFIAGVLSVLCYPALESTLASAVSASDKAAPVISVCVGMLPWVIIALTVIAMSYAAYDITLSVAKKSLQPIRLYH